MRSSKFTLNSFLIVVIIISAIAFFFTVRMTHIADRAAINEVFPIENTEYSVRYSSVSGNGIYRGDENTGVLVVKGTFGNGWGSVLSGDTLYINEYKNTDLGFTTSDLVKINLKTYEKEVLFKNTLLRGQCTSGELVCMSDCIMPSNSPKTNSLCRLYALTDPALNPDSNGATVLFIDANSSEVVYSLKDGTVLRKGFEDKYLKYSLEEVQNEN